MTFFEELMAVGWAALLPTELESMKQEMIEASYQILVQILVKEPGSFYSYPQKYLTFLLGIGYYNWVLKIYRY